MLRCVLSVSPWRPPALWFHNTLALEFGVGVNVFWRQLSVESYDKRDPYGNKDPVAVSRAMQTLDRALRALDDLPPDYRDFYARRMVVRIQNRAYSTDPEKTGWPHEKAESTATADM